MKKNVYFVFIAASFALLASAPGRLAYGIPLIIELNLLVSGATAFNLFAKRLDLGALQEMLSLSFIIFLAILFKEILILYSPVVALTLGFSIFIPASSAFLLGTVFSGPSASVSRNAILAAWFSVFAFVFFLLRDILGYGAVSLPVPGGIAEAAIFESHKSAFFSFFATIPGSLLLLAFCMSVLLAAQTRLNVLEKAEALDENS